MTSTKPYTLYAETLKVKCCQDSVRFDRIPIGFTWACTCGDTEVVRDYLDWIEVKIGNESIHEIR